MINLKNKKAVITGATGGIGFSIIENFYNQGAKIIGTGTNDEKLEMLKKKFDGIKLQKFDISKHNEIEKFVDIVCEQLEGCPDILINNAGITKDNLSLRMTHAEWEQVINVNLTSTFLLCKFFLKKMIKNKSGKIINITSVVGHTGNVGQANYAASKSGIIGMSKSLALEYAKKYNINCISPDLSKQIWPKLTQNLKN